MKSKHTNHDFAASGQGSQSFSVVCIQEGIVHPPRINWQSTWKMAKIICETCGEERELVPVYRSAMFSGVSRATIYHWMRKGWIHWVESPSGRRLVCVGSLARRPRKVEQVA